MVSDMQVCERCWFPIELDLDELPHSLGRIWPVCWCVWPAG